MAFIYRVSFDLDPDQVAELSIGAPLERVIGYLRVLLPSHQGYLTSRAMYAVEPSEPVEVAFESVWQSWGDLVAHRESDLVEAKVLAEFGLHISRDALRVGIYEEIP